MLLQGASSATLVYLDMDGKTVGPLLVAPGKMGS